MAAPGLTPEAQKRYILQWFGEFSELQRDDFLPVLCTIRGHRPEITQIYLQRLSSKDKPVSLFQCRIKLFSEWYLSWSDAEKRKLVDNIIELDPMFGSRVHDFMLNGPPQEIRDMASTRNPPENVSDNENASPEEEKTDTESDPDSAPVR